MASGWTRTASMASTAPAAPQPAADGTLWAGAQARLHGEDAAVYGAWFHPLTEVGMEEGSLTLAAPTRFHARYVEQHLRERLLAALRAVEPSVRSVSVIA